MIPTSFWILEQNKLLNFFDSSKEERIKENYNLFNAGVELFAEPLCVEVPEDDSAEDGVDGGVGEEVDVEGVEVPDEATCT